MSSIDRRIVDMQFNNGQFESGVKTSIKTLDKLKASLKLDDSAKSLSNLQSAGKKFSLSNIADSVQSISDRFTNLGIVGVTALQNITNAAMNAGTQLVKSLTLDPIMSGFNEYETKMNAITTILTNTQSKGTTLDDVNKALGELNEYADQTIYNFAEMTRNIGTFTAAGVDLDTSVASIKGIANLAAGSGSSALQASTAMYQLSQAIASGTVKLQDWNSVVNAGMGGELFQNALKETAKELNIFVDETVPFRESLHQGWLTTEVLTTTLQKFANDDSLIKAATQVKTFTQLFDTMKESVQSGWAVSWEYIIGDREQAAQLLTGISEAFNNLIGPSTEARNAMLKFWNENGGRDAIIEALTNAFSALGDILNPVQEAFRSVFPPITGEQLVSLSNKLKELTSNFKVTEETVNNIRNTFKGLFSVINIGIQAIKAIGTGLINLINFFSPVGSGILGVTGTLGSFVTKINESISSTNIFEKAIQGLGKILQPIGEGIKKIFTGITNSIQSLDIDFNIFDGMINIAQAVSKAFSGMQEMVSNAMKNLGFDNVLDVVNGGLLAAILLGVKKLIKNIGGITKGASGFLEGITNILDSVKKSLEAWQSNLKANVLIKIAGAIAILAASLAVLSMIDPVSLMTALGGITALFVELFASMAIFEKVVGGAGFKSMGKITIAMLGLSTAILILSSAVSKLANLNWGQLATGLTGVGVLMGELVAASIILSKSSGQLIKGSTGLILFATSMVILSQAVSQLGSLNVAEITTGLVGVGVLLTEVSAFMKLTDFSGMGVSNAAGILILATALNVLSSAVSVFSNMNIGQIVQGLAAVGVVLTELVIFVNKTGNAKNVITTATGLTILGAAMKIFASATADFGNIPWDALGRGLVGMAGALTIVTVAVNLMPKNMIASSVGILVISAALVVLSNALQNMGGMSWEEIAKGLVTLAGSLTVIAIAMAFMTTALAGAAALLVISAALAVLAPVLIALGSMSLGEVGTALLALAGAFIVLGGAALLLTPVTPIILALGVAVAALGVGMLAAGSGVLMFATGLATLGASFAVNGAVIISALTQIISLIPLLATKIGEGIVAMVVAIGNGAGAIVGAVTQIITQILQAVMSTTPLVVEAFTTIFKGILEAIRTITPDIVDTVLTVLESIIEGTVEFVPYMADAGLRLITGLLQGIADNIPSIAEAGTNIIIAFLEAIGAQTPRIVDAGFKMIIDFINGLANSINTNTPLLVSAMNNLVTAAINAAITFIIGSAGSFLGAGITAIGGLISGVGSKIGEIWTTVSNGINQAIEGIRGTVGSWISAGANIITGFIDGIKGKISEAATWAANLAKSALDAAKNALGIASPSRAFIAIGNYIGEGLAKGIRDSSWQAVYATEETANKVINAAAGAFEDIENYISTEKHFDNLSLEEELEIWEAAIARFAEGSEERLKAEKNAYSVYKEIQDRDYQDTIDNIEKNREYGNWSIEQEIEAYKNLAAAYKEGSEEHENALEKIRELEYQRSNEWIDEEKRYGRLSIEDEIAAYERMLPRYEKFSDEYKEITEKLYDLNYQRSTDWISEEKDFGRLSLADELAAYRRMLPRYEKFSDEYKSISKEIYRLETEINDAYKEYEDERTQIQEEAKEKRLELEQEYADKTKEINDKLAEDIKQLDEEYASALENRTKSLYDSYGLFDEVTAKEEVSGSTLMKNLQDQVDEFQDWKKNLDQLSARGLNSALIEELQEMGPSAIAEIKALNSMSDSQLAQYATLWSTKHEEAKDRATAELEDLRIETESKIEDLKYQAEIDLEEYKDVWNQKMEDLNADTTKQLSDLEIEFKKKVGIIKSNTEEETTQMVSNVKRIMREAGWNEVGEQIVDGLISGMKSKEPDLAAAATEMSNVVQDTTKEVNDIHSPSKVFAKFGQYMGDGLIAGIKGSAGKAISTVKDMGRDVIDAMGKALKNATEIASMDIDAVPTIRPVIDLTDIHKGFAQIDRIASANRSMTLGMNILNVSQNRDEAHMNELISKITDSNAKSDAKITDAIASLKEDFAEIVDRMSQLQVVMDTGSLVGAITPEMDRSLGTLAAMNRRGSR